MRTATSRKKRNLGAMNTVTRDEEKMKKEIRNYFVRPLFLFSFHILDLGGIKLGRLAVKACRHSASLRALINSDRMY